MILKDAIWELLETNYSQTSEHLVAALEMEYPEVYKKIQESFRNEYGDGCGMRMSPITAVNNTLEQMLKIKLVERRLDRNNYCWRKLSQEDV